MEAKLGTEDLSMGQEDTETGTLEEYATMLSFDDKTRTVRYISVRQLIGTRTGRYQAKSTVGSRLRKKKERRRGEVPRAVLAATPPGGRPRAVATRAALAPSPPAGDFSPHAGRWNVPHVGESSRRRVGMAYVLHMVCVIW
ncbi:hypothetical protein GW17_00003920 [Ensete ventricosum]|nr:hypothetical protein GW17_00003920 [Ensete ventricosum]